MMRPQYEQGSSLVQVATQVSSGNRRAGRYTRCRPAANTRVSASIADMVEIPTFPAQRNPRLRARIVEERPLVYDAWTTLRGERPAHVASPSGLAWSGGRLVVAQADTDWVALVEERAVTAMPLRGVVATKRDEPGHLNLEALVAAQDWRGEFLLAFGSGRDDDQRSIARLRLGGGDTELSLFGTRRLHAELERLDGYAEGGLAIVGAARLVKAVEGRDGVRLFLGAEAVPRGEDDIVRPPDAGRDATIDLRIDSLLGYLDRCRHDGDAFLGFAPQNHRRYDLDEFESVAFHFTDAAAFPTQPEHNAFLAIAERDGACVATAFGVIDGDGSAQYTLVAERDGRIATRHAAGLALSADGEAWMVARADEEGRPASLLRIELRGL